ncbi:cytochrome c3 family protein [Limisalsivibrio acetivorans]|uniref:cytochrome c3 family protein n=1 Tax=Limisalsivibrio acetivorans TaxID=1304888 RepID=UPI0003B480BF|nr:cytochrome c3 family protein [Limisalsivibrio acetivorans]
MKKRTLLILTAFIIAAVGCSKFYYRTPYLAFNHEKHVDILFQQEKDCFYCHKLPDLESFAFQGQDFKIDAELKIDGKCHDCHKDETTRVAKAPGNCKVCHDNLKTMKPDDHQADWTKLHAVPAKLDKSSCESCHSDWYCEDCHSKQKSIEDLRHPRAYKLTHSMDAMIDPGSCDVCHRTGFCIECHSR